MTIDQKYREQTMNIESKRFKIESKIGGFIVTNKETKEMRHVPSADVPSVNYLSAISESEFDKEMEKLME